jgi:hypothetical protein
VYTLAALLVGWARGDRLSFLLEPQVVRRRVGQTCEDTDGPSTAHDKDKDKDKGEPASPYTVDPTRAILTILTPQQMDVVRKAHTGEDTGKQKGGDTVTEEKGLFPLCFNDVSLWLLVECESMALLCVLLTPTLW